MADERGVEPTVMKILVGIILVAIGLGVGITVYQRFGGAATSALNYSVNATPNSATMSEGEDKTVSIEVRTEVGFDEDVSLTATGVPSSVTVSFSPSSGTPTFNSTMTVVVATGAPTGTHSITIRASTDDGEKTEHFELTIE